MRDEMSSLTTLGFRIDGIDGAGSGDLRHHNYFATVKERPYVLGELMHFVKSATSAGASPDMLSEQEMIRLHEQLSREIATQLKNLRDCCERSSFVKSHEFVGASLLICMDASPPRVSVHLIDLAKTSMLPEKVCIDHRSPWKNGNHEDGFLFGIESCISCFEDVAAAFSSSSQDHNST